MRSKASRRTGLAQVMTCACGVLLRMRATLVLCADELVRMGCPRLPPIRRRLEAERQGRVVLESSRLPCVSDLQPDMVATSWRVG